MRQRILVWKLLPLKLLVLNLVGLGTGGLLFVFAISGLMKLSNQLEAGMVLGTAVLALISLPFLYLSMVTWIPSLVSIDKDSMTVWNFSHLLLVQNSNRDVHSGKHRFALSEPLKFSSTRDPLFKGVHLCAEFQGPTGAWNKFSICSHCLNSTAAIARIKRAIKSVAKQQKKYERKY